MMKDIMEKKPVVYSCSGCSSAAQMANYLAVRLNEEGIARMSCIAGLGANNDRMVRAAKTGRKIIAIDGCKLGCAKQCLSNHGIKPSLYMDLQQWGIRKKENTDFDKKEADNILLELEKLIRDINRTPLPGKEITVKEVLNESQFELFIDLPYQLYKGNSFYVPALKKDTRNNLTKDKNPAFDFCESRYWLAYRNGRVVGRIAGIINHAFNERWNKRYMRFGWFDFEEDEIIAEELFKKVEGWAIEKGLNAVHGPLGFTNFDHAGILVNGFDQPGTFAAIYNYPYYPQAIENAGYVKEVDWVEYKIRVPKEMSEKLERISGIVKNRYGLHVAEVRSKNELLGYGKDIFRLLNLAYADLFGMVPLTDKQVDHNIKKYLSFIRPDLVALILDEKNELVAFGITMPSLSRALQKANGNLYPFGFIHLMRAMRNNRFGDMCLVAVKPELQGKAVNAMLMHHLTIKYMKAGIEYAESNPELEENLKVQAIWEYYEAEQHKRRRCYIKFLDDK